MGEKIVAVVQNESKTVNIGRGVGSGLFAVRTGEGGTLYDLYFTDKRMIAAVVFCAGDLSKWGAKAKFQGMRWQKKREEARKKYEKMTPQQILEAHERSFEVPYDKVESVKIKKGLFGAKMDIEAEFKGTTEKFSLPVPKRRADEVRSVLAKYLRGKVH